ncbi:MAG TPA: orotate phosphoribosyltransferase [Spirochaetota bacterium]|nr:orotate phosphoribosyltransferase [Spirochaetota bacterium]
MKDYKRDFIHFLLKMKALRFGEFTLKSGRLSPYFLNTGMLHNGEAVARLGSFYASAIVDNINEGFTAVFGPAYKGIPLAVATVNALFLNHGINVDYSFNRKEAKDHGDKGLIVGRELTTGNRVVVVDDVITAGTAVRETMEILKAQGNPEIAAVIVSVDRMEKGTGEKSAIQEIAESTGIRFYPIVTILDIIEYLKSTTAAEHGVDISMVAKMEEYRAKYGVG